MAGIGNGTIFGNSFKLQPSAASDIALASLTSSDIAFLNYVGNPNGAVTANPAALCFDYTVGTVYVKASGTGNTGWVLLSTASTDLHSARFIVSPGGEADGANYTTIGAAITAAVAKGGNQSIFIQPGTYTENPTLAAGINLVAFNCDANGTITGGTPNVIINGTCTATFAGTACLSGICLQTNSAHALTVSGSNATNVILSQVFLNALNNEAVLLSSTGGSQIYYNQCNGNLGATGFGYFTQSGAGSDQWFIGGFFENIGGSVTPSILSGSSAGLTMYNVDFFNSITSSSSSSTAIQECYFSMGNSTLTIGGTGVNTLFHSSISSGSSVGLSIGVGAACYVDFLDVNSSNTHAISGAGILELGVVVFTGSSSNINTTTVTALPISLGTIQQGTWQGSNVALNKGGTNASLTASNGGIFYSTATAGAILSGTATAGQILQSGSSTTPTWSTATYPATAGSSGNVLTSNGTNFVSQAPVESVTNYTNVNHAASPYTVLSTDSYISVDCSGGAVTLKFPNSPTANQVWIVKDRTGNASTNNISLTTVGGSVTFDGVTTYAMAVNYGSVQILANATPTYEIF
jgi:hypothetical protein